MNLNKMFVFIFVFMGLFAVLLATMPSEFIILGVTATTQDKEAAQFFNAQNVTMYNYTLSVDLTRGVSKQENFGLGAGQKLEFWWDTVPRYAQVAFQLKHLTDQLWGWWWGQHNLEVQQPYRSKLRYPDYPQLGLLKEDVVTNLYNDERNNTYCEFGCSDGLSVKVFILPANLSWTLEESWDNGKLTIFTSYDIDWTKTSTSTWTMIFNLLTFQNPDLGIPGTGGFVLNTGIALALWACVALLAFALVTSVIPFIRGWVGGGGG